MNLFSWRKKTKQSNANDTSEHPYYNATHVLPDLSTPTPTTSTTATTATTATPGSRHLPQPTVPPLTPSQALSPRGRRAPASSDAFSRVPSAHLDEPFVRTFSSGSSNSVPPLQHTPYKAALLAYEAANNNNDNKNNNNNNKYGTYYSNAQPLPPKSPGNKPTQYCPTSSTPPAPLYYPPKQNDPCLALKYSRKTPRLLIDAFFALLFWLLAPLLVLTAICIGIPALLIIAIITEIVSTCICSDRLRFPVRTPEPLQALETCMADEYGLDIQHVSEQFVFTSNHASYTADARAVFIANQRKHGTSRTLVFLHTYGDTAMQLLPIADSLSASYTVISIHLPGFGRSSVSPHPQSSNDYATCTADFVEAFLYHAGITDRVLVMAHGYGAVPALAFVEQHRKRVAGLILLSPATIFPSLGRNGFTRALALKMRFPYIVRYVGPVLAWAILCLGWVSERDAAFYYYYSILSNKQTISAAKYMAQSVSLGFTGAHYNSPTFVTLTRLIFSSFPIWTIYARDDPFTVDGNILENVLGIPCTSADGDPKRLIASENADVITGAVTSLSRLKGGEYTSMRRPLERLPNPEWFASTCTPFDYTTRAETMAEAYAACCQ